MPSIMSRQSKKQERYSRNIRMNASTSKPTLVASKWLSQTCQEQLKRIQSSSFFSLLHRWLWTFFHSECKIFARTVEGRRHVFAKHDEPRRPMTTARDVTTI